MNTIQVAASIVIIGTILMANTMLSYKK